MAANDPQGRSRRGTRTRRYFSRRAAWRWIAKAVMISTIIDPWVVYVLTTRQK